VSQEARESGGVSLFFFSITTLLRELSQRPQGIALMLFKDNAPDDLRTSHQGPPLKHPSPPNTDTWRTSLPTHDILKLYLNHRTIHLRFFSFFVFFTLFSLTSPPSPQY
jgi:hypothetical protein